MAIFNSLGSNYTFQTVLDALFSKNDPKNIEDLKKFLEAKYEGKAELYYKGRHAITRALNILKLNKDDKVAITGFTCFAVYKAVKDAGLTPVCLDIENSLNFTAEALTNVLSNHSTIKAVIIQNTLGYPCDIFSIQKICQEKQIALIEDLAHCIGTKYADGSEAGTIGDMTACSFSQDKVVDGISGGALIVRNVKYQFMSTTDKLQKLEGREENKDKIYPMLTLLIRGTYDIYLGKVLHTVLKKLNLLSRPVEISQKALLEMPARKALLILKAWNAHPVMQEHRRQIAVIYREKLSEKLQLPKVSQLVESSANLRYPLIIKNREGLITFLKNRGFHISDIWYDAPIGPKKYLSMTEYNNECPTAQNIADNIINLPTHRKITMRQAHILADTINLWYQGNAND